jgi:hypothetical protein
VGGRMKGLLLLLLTSCSLPNKPIILEEGSCYRYNAVSYDFRIKFIEITTTDALIVAIGPQKWVKKRIDISLVNIMRTSNVLEKIDCTKDLDR